MVIQNSLSAVPSSMIYGVADGNIEGGALSKYQKNNHLQKSDSEEFL